MGKIYFTSIRLAFALVCVGASLILGGHWLGLIPDSAPVKLRARNDMTETIAINAAAHVRKNQWSDLKTTLQTHVDRSDQLISIGVRSDMGTLRIATGHHEDTWRQRDEENSRVQAYNVPITLNRRPWGQVEVCFANDQPTAMGKAMGNPVTRLLVYFFVAGLVAYTIFVTRIMRVFNSTQVVPDRVRQALDTLAEGLLILDEQEKIVLANQAFAESVGMQSSELIGATASHLPWEHIDGTPDSSYPWTMAIDQFAVKTDHLLRFNLPDGQQCIFSVNAAPLGNDASHKGTLATFRDVTHIEKHRVELESMLSMLRSSRDEVERKNAELEILATQDALTGCLNRRAFFARFDRLWEAAKKANAPLSCIMIDNDHFKNVNDTYGHQVGDEVLRRVARTIRDQHGERGLVCRYGGEEFCVVLPGCTLEQALDLANETREAIAAITFDDPAELTLTASMGVSEMCFEPVDPQEMINQADICLYTAKHRGRNCVVQFDPNTPEGEALAETTSEENASELSLDRIDIPYRAVTALVAALSYRDANTAEHSRRVAELCNRVADDILDQQQIFVLEVAALLHDIGKVGVPDHVLLKPGPLTPEEWEIMSRHDRIGVEIVASAFDCNELTNIMGSHHAFFGGVGRHEDLPQGLDIPIGGRILTICDSYDAMVSDRVYRKGCSHRDAIAELRRCAGTQFDPEMVEHFALKITHKPVSSTDSCSIRNSEAAIQIGYQVERLAEAVDSQDASSMKMLAARLSMYARNCNLEPIALQADKIEHQIDADNIQWINLLRDTYELLDICRSAQSEILNETLEGAHNAMQK
ncbi:diguanylate cyclase [Stieleria marina]|uniref:diguanylate cyclase n=1 Tax=Stieleria marina TaxID=1930275 RepID=A0A517NX14_9BACT|nr:Response regulator PleD [Planctomycetes bacterium K23_9]